MEEIIKLLDKNGLVFAFFLVSIIMYGSYYMGKKLTNNKAKISILEINKFNLMLIFIKANYKRKKSSKISITNINMDKLVY
jgi:hypothetical protein